MKKIIPLTFCVMFTLSSFAQGFEWVRTYTGEEITSGVTTNQLKGSCVDSADNLYILGEFSPQALTSTPSTSPAVTTADGRELTFRLMRQYGRR